MFRRKNPQNEKPNMKSTTSPTSFYTDCVADYHEKAKELGYANRGVIFIPELLPIGQKTAMTFLNDRFFIMQYKNDPKMFYYVVTALTLQAGIVFAKKWHEDYEGLQNGYVDEILKVGPANSAYEILLSEFNMDKKGYTDFSQAIFDRWLAMHEPYWDMNDPRDYTFSAITAAFQLGISMILEKYGF